MTTVILIAFPIWFFAAVLVVALCRSSARGDATFAELAPFQERPAPEAPGLVVWDAPAEVGARDLRPLAHV